MAIISDRVKEIHSSSTLAITARAKAMRAEGFDVVSFAAGEPDFDTPAYIRQAAINAINDGFTKYTPSTGTPELKRVICEKFRRDNNLEYEPSQIIVSNGAKQCLFNVIAALIDKLDEAIIPSPYWVSYVEMVRFAQGRAVIVKTKKENSFKLDIAALEKVLTPKTKLLILNSPSNPTGCVYTKDELSAIAEICVKNNIFVVSDEIYEKLIYDGKPHVSIASVNEKIYDLTFVVNGVSKAYSMTGWRIGYLAGNEKIIKILGNLQDHSTSNPCSISQKAAFAALTSGDDFVDKMRVEFAARRDYMLSYLEKMKLRYIKPEGAFYVFCDISQTGLKSQDFAEKLLEQKYVASIPGSAFGNDNYVRFSFATNMAEIKKGMNRLNEFIKGL